MFNFFVQEDSRHGNSFIISGGDFNHIKNVLRMKPGEELAVIIEPKKTSLLDSTTSEIYEPVSVKLDTIAQVASGSFNAVNSAGMQMKVFKEVPPAKIALSDISRFKSSGFSSSGNCTA